MPGSVASGRLCKKMYRLPFETQSNGTFPAVKPRSTSLKMNDATTAAPPCDVT